MKAMRAGTLESLGLGSPLAIFKNGRMPVDLGEMVDRVFGPEGNRGSLVITGGNGIVGAGKAMQLGARLLPFGVPIVALDLPDAPAGLKGHYDGLKRSFGPAKAAEIMSNVIQLTYDGKRVPPLLKSLNPKFVLEAIPEILPLKRSHYAMLRENFPGMEIRSVTSGFPSKELGVGILHPSFPHQINKVWEVVEDSPSDITKLIWAMGLQPVPVGDHWSFILDVLFCGVTLAAIRYHEATNMPYWKLDKYVRRLVGPNPLRAHDAIGPGASFLTWSCLHHLAGQYGALFEPAGDLVRRKNSGEAWYSSFRPVVDWGMDDEALLEAWVLGPLFQMTSLLLKEDRGSLAHINAIGELCAQFSKGILATARSFGAEKVIKVVEAYHRLHPEAAKQAWYPEVFDQISSPEWQMLYVNAEHDGEVGVVSVSRESLNWDVIAELNRAVDWLKAEGIERVILSGDFHLSTQMLGADTTEFFPALSDVASGTRVAAEWTRAARRFSDEFQVSVGYVGGKRALGGMLELMMHCHYLVAVEDAQLGLPEVTLPVVPGMEGTHLPYRRSAPADWPKVRQMLLTGKAMKAPEAVGWLADYAGSPSECLQMAWNLATGKGSIALRPIQKEGFVLPSVEPMPTPSKSQEAARLAITSCSQASCAVSYDKALDTQARASAEFMLSKPCHKGAVGSAMKKAMV